MTLAHFLHTVESGEAFVRRNLQYAMYILGCTEDDIRKLIEEGHLTNLADKSCPAFEAEEIHRVLWNQRQRELNEVRRQVAECLKLLRSLGREVRELKQVLHFDKSEKND